MNEPLLSQTLKLVPDSESRWTGPVVAPRLNKGIYKHTNPHSHTHSVQLKAPNDRIGVGAFRLALEANTELL